MTYPNARAGMRGGREDEHAGVGEPITASIPDVEFKHTISLLQELVGPVCRWCGERIVRDGERWRDDELGSLCCEAYVEGCGACDDGEPHPHEPS